MIFRRRPAALLAALTVSVVPITLALHTGCMHGCTAAACLDGFEVIATGVTTEPVIIEAHTSDAVIALAATRRLVAPADTQFVARFEITPAEVTLVVRTPTDTAEVTVQPQYERLQPNGPGCDPICWSATEDVTVDLSR